MNGLENINGATGLRKKLRGMILNGTLPPGSRLPGARTLSRKCGLHYQTINRIYHELTECGLVEIRQGHGTVVRHPDLSQVRILALMFKSEDNERSHQYYHHEFIKGIEEKQTKSGVQLDFREIRVDEPAATFAGLLRKMPIYDGIIVLHPLCARIDNFLFACNIPVVIYMDADSMPFSTVTYDSTATTYMTTCHLIENGCRKIGLVIRNIEHSNIQRKVIGYIRAMRDHRLAIEPDFIWELKGQSQFFSVVQRINDHMKTHRLLNGYLCTGSNEGVILASCMRRDGVKIPEQTMIIGYDEVEGCDDITRVVLPRRACALRCVDWILEHLGHPVLSDKVFIPSTLHIGNTTVKTGGKKCKVS